MDRQAGTDGGRHRLLDYVGLAGTCVLGGLLYGTLLDAGNARRNTDDHARLGETVRVHPADEVTQHHLADLKVRDDTVFQGPDRLDVAGRAADHPLGLDPDGERMTVLDVDGDDRGLIEHYSAAPHVDEGVGGT